MKIFKRLIVLVVLVLSAFQAQSQVTQCVEKMSPIKDGLLQRFAVELKLKHPEVDFGEDGPPCEAAARTVKNLKKTIEKNYLKRISGYEHLKGSIGEVVFTVDHFKSSNLGALQALNAALSARRSSLLAIEAPTKYGFFLTHDSFVIIFFYGMKPDDLEPMVFQALKEVFLGPYGKGS